MLNSQPRAEWLTINIKEPSVSDDCERQGRHAPTRYSARSVRRNSWRMVGLSRRQVSVAELRFLPAFRVNSASRRDSLKHGLFNLKHLSEADRQRLQAAIDLWRASWENCKEDGAA